MMRRTGRLANRGTRAVIVAAALLICSDARAQSSGGGGPLAFFDNIFTGSLSKGSQAAPSSQRPGASAQAQGAPAATSAPQPWSGEDRASGHPLMTPSPIREAAANFDNCVASMWPDAARRNISPENFQRFTAGLGPH